jgi:hypothetical protein
MMIVHHQLPSALLEERLARADRARVLSEIRRSRKAQRRPSPAASSPEADVVDLVFGCQCEADQIGA